MLDPRTITRETFEDAGPDGFKLSFEDERHDLELIGAESLKAHPGHPRQVPPFTIFLRGPSDLMIPGRQGMCTISHGDMGEIEAFVVMLGPDEAGQLLQVVFN
ncbi:MAG TPA: hypothetical protein VGA70_14610 [Longimicrobiales bacterium]|jgi:hypothetical protein